LFLGLPLTAIAEPSPVVNVAAEVKLLTPLPLGEEPKPKPATGVLCNCWSFVKSVYPSLPGTNYVLSNLSNHGEVIVFYYKEVGLHHYAVVRGETDTHYAIEETNYKGCQHGRRLVSKDDPSIVGFFIPK
jgi:hypothetical protein